MKDLIKSILHSVPRILHMKQSSKPDSLSPEERQDRKAMKERKTTKSPKTPSNAPRKPQYVPMPAKEDHCVYVREPYMLGNTLQMPLLKAIC